MSAPLFPLPEGSDDSLSDDVVELVADLLTSCGLPFIGAGPDLDRLRAALRWFAYGTQVPNRQGASPGG
jgi:hypothetical protein